MTASPASPPADLAWLEQRGQERISLVSAGPGVVGVRPSAAPDPLAVAASPAGTAAGPTATRAVSPRLAGQRPIAGIGKDALALATEAWDTSAAHRGPDVHVDLAVPLARAEREGTVTVEVSLGG